MNPRYLSCIASFSMFSIRSWGVSCEWLSICPIRRFEIDDGRWSMRFLMKLIRPFQSRSIWPENPCLMLISLLVPCWLLCLLPVWFGPLDPAMPTADSHHLMERWIGCWTSGPGHLASLSKLWSRGHVQSMWWGSMRNCVLSNSRAAWIADNFWSEKFEMNQIAWALHKHDVKFSWCSSLFCSYFPGGRQCPHSGSGLVSLGGSILESSCLLVYLSMVPLQRFRFLHEKALGPERSETLDSLGSKPLKVT